MKKEQNDPMELANEIRKSLNKLIALNDSLIADLSDEDKKKIAPIQQDIHATLRAVKNGDVNKINEISKKYASSDFNGNI